MPRQEEDQNNRRFLDEFLELYRQLSPWGRFQVHLYLKGMMIQRLLGKIVWDWLIIQWEIDQAMGAELHKKNSNFADEREKGN